MVQDGTLFSAVTAAFAFKCCWISVAQIAKLEAIVVCLEVIVMYFVNCAKITSLPSAVLAWVYVEWTHVTFLYERAQFCPFL